MENGPNRLTIQILFIYRKFKLWNQLSSTVLLIFVITLGFVANVFICYCIYRKKIGTKYVNPVLLALSLKNIFAISTCVPLATVMLNVPSTIVRLSCDIQENITFIILFAGYLFPMLLSMVQCDHVLRPRKHLIGGKRIHFLVFLISVMSVLMGIQSKLSKDDHGCHLWSIRTDPIVLSYIYSIASVFLLTLVVMVTCYMMIYFQARASQAAIETSAHKEKTTEGKFCLALPCKHFAGKCVNKTVQKILIYSQNVILCQPLSNKIILVIRVV